MFKSHNQNWLICALLPFQRPEGKTTVPLSLESDGTNYSPIQLSKSHTLKGQPHHYIQGNPVTSWLLLHYETPQALKELTSLCDTEQPHVPDLHSLPIKGEREGLSWTNECPWWSWPWMNQIIKKKKSVTVDRWSCYFICLFLKTRVFSFYIRNFSWIIWYLPSPFLHPVPFLTLQRVQIWKSANCGYRKQIGARGGRERKKKKAREFIASRVYVFLISKERNIWWQGEVCLI